MLYFLYLIFFNEQFKLIISSIFILYSLFSINSIIINKLSSINSSKNNFLYKIFLKEKKSI